jgi:hypothetical protein
VTSSIELLDVLPTDRMEALLRAELKERGFEEDGELLVQVQDDGVLVEIDPRARTVTIRAITDTEVELEHTKESRVYGESEEKAEHALREHARAMLERQAERTSTAQKSELAARLEGRLRDLRTELDAVSHRVIASALKERAAQLGEVREIEEDEDAQSLTIRIKL